MSESPGARDDFKLITGIGPAIERRLHEAGIVTFSQLAGLTDEAIAGQLQGLAGMSPERVKEQEWLRQAQELAQLSPLVEDAPQEMAANGQHYATFTVELLMEETNEVRRTRVVHVQDRDTDTWAGWDSKRLMQFIEQQAALTIVAQEAEEEEAAPRPETTALSGDLKLRELQVTSADRPEGTRLMNREQPFDVRLVLDMESVETPPAGELHYSAQVYAKGLRDGRRHLLGQVDGETPAAESLVIQVPARASQMTAGAYRLEADIALRAPTGRELLTSVPGILVQLS
ncbi:MAG TPA: hypothetical protein VK879_02905 [Candidatus Sulfomarinibacteraceae bacterium]|nr:hypothetical protein [Candidatus Sulfomarinibacteraceae bacterium]